MIHNILLYIFASSILVNFFFRDVEIKFAIYALRLETGCQSLFQRRALFYGPEMLARETILASIGAGNN